MRPANVEEDIRKIVAADPRYPYEAYVFVQEALQHTQHALGRNKSERKHVGGKELLEGIRQFALKSYGPMVPTLLEEWGIHSCEDFRRDRFQHDRAQGGQQVGDGQPG